MRLISFPRALGFAKPQVPICTLRDDFSFDTDFGDRPAIVSDVSDDLSTLYPLFWPVQNAAPLPLR